MERFSSEAFKASHYNLGKVLTRSLKIFPLETQKATHHKLEQSSLAWKALSEALNLSHQQLFINGKRNQWKRFPFHLNLGKFLIRSLEKFSSEHWRAPQKLGKVQTLGKAYYQHLGNLHIESLESFSLQASKAPHYKRGKSSHQKLGNHFIRSLECISSQAWKVSHQKHGQLFIRSLKSFTSET